MNFTSPSYYAFLPIVWLVSLVLPYPRLKQLALLFASLVFYATWGPMLVIVLLATAVVNFGWAAWMRRQRTPPILWGGLVFNIAVLASFKYLPRFIGLSRVDEALFPLAEPIGLSFYTFQAMSYLIDTYRAAGGTVPTPREFLLYIAFWPTVTAGPICRIGEMLGQYRALTAPTVADILTGVGRIALGLFMKLGVADTLAMGVTHGAGIDAGFSRNPRTWSALDVWTLLIGFGFQLFCDFAGYSHIAIGTARVFGVRVRENFNAPYMSRTPIEFWTKWHMSLSSWIRDYLYFPLAIMNGALWWRSLSLVLSMIVFGLWHGASFLFLLWGAYHGTVLAACHALRWLGRMRGGEDRDPSPMRGGWSVAATFLVVTAGWVAFRAQDLRQAAAMAHAILSPAAYGRSVSLPSSLYALVGVVTVGYFTTQWLQPRVRQLFETNGRSADLFTSEST